MARVLTRRRFFAATGSLLVGSGAYAYGIEPHRVSIVRRDLPIAELPGDLDGKILVQISDLHIGPTDTNYLLGCFEQVKNLRPELIVMTGDWMTGRSTEVIGTVGRVVSQLTSPPLGIIGTLGNHDYGPTWSNKSIADELAPVLRDSGIRLLRNEVVDVAGLQVIGLDELWARQFKPEIALTNHDPNRAAIALSHNPDTLDRGGWENYKGWVLSGHTHGGQCKFPFFRPPYLPVDNPRYTAGEFDMGDGRKLYINRGLGYNRRVRFNARPEITNFTLRQVNRLV